MKGSTQGGGILVSSNLRDMGTHFVKCMVSLARRTYFLTCIKQPKTIALDVAIFLESLEKLGSSAQRESLDSPPPFLGFFCAFVIIVNPDVKYLFKLSMNIFLECL